MQVTRIEQADRRGASAHRSGGISFISLLHGLEDTPGNFHLMLVEADNYQAPQHRHNFDQVRVVLEGAFGYGAGLRQEAGTLGYFPEGTYYTQSSQGRSLTLLLQAGGASGLGYMSDRQLRAAVTQLQSKGSFAEGVFTWVDATGKKHNQDGYEAAWEHVRGQKIRYPRPLFEGPVLWRSDRFESLPTAQTGVLRRDFARFTTRGLGVAEVQLDPHTRWRAGCEDQDVLLCQIAGSAHVDLLELPGRYDSVHLAAGEYADITAGAEGARYYEFSLMQR